MFGQNLIAVDDGIIEIGDRLKTCKNDRFSLRDNEM
jgi:hypothetical protein